MGPPPGRSGESDTESLAQVTRALIELGRKRQARDLMVSWPDRPGVNMWMVANETAVIGFPWVAGASGNMLASHRRRY